MMKKMSKEIVLDEEKLGVRCDEIDPRTENKLMREIIVELKNKIRENNLIGLAANQIGYDKRIFVLNFQGDLRSFVNPVISEVGQLELSRESCASIPDKEFVRPRHNEITVTYMTPLGKIESRKLIGMAATVFQHELDHLDGMLLSDIGFEVDEDFDNASDEEKEKIVEMYLDSLDLRSKQLNEEIENDAELKQTSDAVKFIQKVQAGEIEVEYAPVAEEEILSEEVTEETKE